MCLPAVVLYQPQIPPNAGNIIRLCANTGAELHFVHPLGFRLDDRRLRRAGLDYHELTRFHEHKSLQDYIASYRPNGIFAFSSQGGIRHDSVRYTPGSALLFGPETTGLPAEVLAALENVTLLRIPMRHGSRSMNLANCVAVAVYEAWRRQDFRGGT